VQAFESPWASKRTMTVFTASAPEVLLHRVRELVDPAEWTQLAGDVSMLSEGQTPSLPNVPGGSSISVI